MTTQSDAGHSFGSPDPAGRRTCGVCGYSVGQEAIGAETCAERARIQAVVHLAFDSNPKYDGATGRRGT
ncbi:MAG: hypothetical protein L3J97_01930 [Thermoplasmata archaeon]|nr:hypothetical protein [Thermoplasmata archaeon]